MLCRPYGQPSGQGFGYGESAVQKWGAPGAHGAPVQQLCAHLGDEATGRPKPGDVTVVPYGPTSANRGVGPRNLRPAPGQVVSHSPGPRSTSTRVPKFDRKSVAGSLSGSHRFLTQGISDGPEGARPGEPGISRGKGGQIPRKGFLNKTRIPGKGG